MILSKGFPMEEQNTLSELTDISRRLMAISNDALLYTKDRFDRERFLEVRSIAARILEMSAEGITKEWAEELFEENEGYQTPKIDTRAAVFNEKDEVLLVRDYDGKWALPGGWCEYDLTIMENTVKEASEEAGIDVKPVKLVAAHSNKRDRAPKSYFYITRFFILCEKTGGQFRENSETTDARYFPVDSLPDDLNDHKSSADEIRLCLSALHDDDFEPDID